MPKCRDSFCFVSCGPTRHRYKYHQRLAFFTQPHYIANIATSEIVEIYIWPGWLAHMIRQLVGRQLFVVIFLNSREF
jgi:hypothetical protein